MEKFLKVLHLFGLDVLLLKAFEKLVTGLTKKYEAYKTACECFLCRYATATA